MSLLNDALRKAEGRREAPETSGVYTGATRASAVPNRKSRWPFLLLVVGLLGGAVLTWVLSRPEASQTGVGQSGPVVRTAGPASSGRVVEASTVVKKQASPTGKTVAPTQETPAGNDMGVPSVTPQPHTTVSRKRQRVAALPVTPSQPKVSPPPSPAEKKASPEERVSNSPVSDQKTVPSQPPAKGSGPDRLSSAGQAGPEQAPAKTTMAPATPEKSAASAKTVTDSESAGATVQSGGVSAAGVVKNTHMTPAVRDQQAADAIRRALDKDRKREAREQLDRVIATQNAPRSRTRWARYQLVHGQPRRALTVLPFDLAASDTTLRLLRARAQLALGEKAAALKTLQSRVPAVSESPEYAITLATLLQQAGDYQAASKHWAGLIAYDDQHGAWWVGLAISLENQQRYEAAVKAYEQALALPDLKPSLDQFVRQRLQAFGSERDYG